MKLQLLVLFTISCSALAYNGCSERSALLKVKGSAYDFSIKLLQRVVQDTDEHFVYSPMSTWLQLSALAEGARDMTFREIWNVTRHLRNKCLKKRFAKTIAHLNKGLSYENKQKSVLLLDSMMGIKRSFIDHVERLYGIKVLRLDFNDGRESARIVNNAIEHGTGGKIDATMYEDDFIQTVMLFSDANYFRSNWDIPFNSANKQSFFSSLGEDLGEVSMMNLQAYFNLLDFPHIGAKVLEIPFAKRNLSMLIFMPLVEKSWIGEIFYKLQGTRLRSIFNLYKQHEKMLVNVTIPKFKLRTEIDNLAELIYDMRIKRVFSPERSELNGISDSRMYLSLMTQITDIDVNEDGVTASAQFLSKNDTSTEFVANKPFVFMIYDKVREFILYAGVYSKPSVV